jgi:hypothetical protein
MTAQRTSGLSYLPVDGVADVDDEDEEEDFDL